MPQIDIDFKSRYEPPIFTPFGARYYIHDEPMCREQWDHITEAIADAITRQAVRSGLIEYEPSRREWERANGFR